MSELQRRLVGLVEEFALPEGARRPLRSLLDTLESDPTAPTTVTAPAEAVEVHIADALDGLSAQPVRGATRIADLGAGAGFPGLVLAVALPQATVTLVESVGKKCAFIERAAEAAGIVNARALHARAEEWPEGVEAHDLVTARAVASLSVLVEYAAPLLELDGHLVAWKGSRDDVEEADGRAAAAAVGLEPVDIVVVPARRGAEHRHLYVYAKRSLTPARFPRRAGMARKRPLTA
ncbi:MAG: 16S rRNA (guanine(527)-N(7))-methyltransferase RsmG [Solirubrobacterales bacterium]|nr:16S rRNA (guanine(527)-N(7))-methyltransferase RsmG [Solirubrobacterales bacterium]